MNLLKDKREQERGGEFDIFPNLPADGFDRDAFNHATVDEQNHRRTASSIVLISAVFLILCLIAAGYYFGVYKAKQLTTPPNPASSVEQEKLPADSSAAQEKPSETIEKDTPVEQAASAEQPAAVEPPQTSIGLAAKIVAILNNIVKENGRIGSVFIDEGSFSAEISSESLESAQSTYDALLKSMPPEVTATSPAPTVKSNILFAGTFNAVAGAVVAEQPNGADLENRMRSWAQQCSLNMETMSTSTQMPRQLFVKMSGTLSGCQAFLELLAKENLKVTVSKIILMPGQAGEYTFVLRLLI
jgi:hypothetical protein